MTAIDLYKGQFWWFVAAALVLLTPQTNPTARRGTFAALNLLFLALHVEALRSWALPMIVGGLVLAWLVLRWVERAGSANPWPLTLGSLAVLAIFLAVAGFVGWTTIEQKVHGKTEDFLAQGFEKGGRLERIVLDVLETNSMEMMFRGVQPVSDDDLNGSEENSNEDGGAT